METRKDKKIKKILRASSFKIYLGLRKKKMSEEGAIMFLLGGKK